MFVHLCIPLSSIVLDCYPSHILLHCFSCYFYFCFLDNFSIYNAPSPLTHKHNGDSYCLILNTWEISHLYALLPQALPQQRIATMAPAMTKKKGRREKRTGAREGDDDEKGHKQCQRCHLGPWCVCFFYFIIFNSN